MNSDGPYNPLDKRNLGDSVASALLKQPVIRLADCSSTAGAGVYAIYYIGGFKAYEPIVSQNINEEFRQPIYVGKAIPRGGRKGGLGADAAKSRALSSRLRKHFASIEQATNLKIEDFYFRALVVDDIWIPLGENVLIEDFRPVWNMIVDGFGNNDPGTRRATQFRSSWDVLHPGRAFAKKLAVGPIREMDVERRISDFFEGRLSPTEPVDNGD